MPCPELRPYVRLFWLLELEDPASFGPAERVGPDGLLELVFHYAEPVRFRFDGEAFAAQPRACAILQTGRFVEFQPERPAGFVTVRFQPWGAWHFLAPPLSELADRQVATRELWGERAAEIEERLAAARGDRERIALVERFLLEQLRRHGKADVEPLVRQVWRARGRAPVADLCRELGIGERRLQRLFADALGTSPKRFSRLTRFLNACRLLASAAEEDLAAVALACGYYDQSHFTAEFRSFSGVTPGRFRAETGISFLEIS